MRFGREEYIWWKGLLAVDFELALDRGMCFADDGTHSGGEILRCLREPHLDPAVAVGPHGEVNS